MRHADPVCTYLLLAVLATACVAMPGRAFAHCDTMDGPVVQTARAALDKGDATPVLKWVKGEDEGTIRKAFERTLSVRKKGADAKELADMYFFETLVRIHRAGEGAPYTGLKPSGPDLAPLTPAVIEADKALENGSSEKLVALVTQGVAAGIRKRFSEASELKKHSEENVKAGRKFVGAYVEFVHYVERLELDASKQAGHSSENAGGEKEPHHGE